MKGQEPTKVNVSPSRHHGSLDSHQVTYSRYSDFEELASLLNNRMQEVMNLAYLLFRADGIADQLRHHLTQAQAQISYVATLTRTELQNQPNTNAHAPTEDRWEEAACG